MSARTLSEFTQLVNQNRQEFSADLFAAVSRHVGGLISSRDRLNFDEAKELLKMIETVDKSTLSERSNFPFMKTPSACFQFYAI